MTDQAGIRADYLFAGGGTGGHLFPGLAVAAALRDLAPESEVTFFTTDRPLDRQLVGPTGFGQVIQPVRPFTLQPLRLPGFWLAWRKSVAAATAWLRQRRPRAVLGLGGYAAGPPVVAAHRLGIPTAILNPDAIPGRANRHLARYADLVVLQWDISRTHFPAATRCEVLGCPIRSEFAGADGAEGRRRLGLDHRRPVLLVTGASQGARTVNQAVIRVWPEFRAAHPEWQLLHLSGAADEAPVRAAFASQPGTHVISFTSEMWLALAAADVVVSRAGASTLAELTALGRPAILLPYPYHRDRHQHANAAVLAVAGAALVLEDQLAAEANAGPLRAALEHLADRGRRAAMAQAAAGLGKIAAARGVAERLLTQ